MGLRQIFAKIENDSISPKDATAVASGQLLLQSHAELLLSDSQRANIDDIDEQEEKGTFTEAVKALTTAIGDFENVLMICNTATMASPEAKQEFLSNNELSFRKSVEKFLRSLSTYQDEKPDHAFYAALAALEKAIADVIHPFDPQLTRPYLAQLDDAITDIKEEKIDVSRLQLVKEFGDKAIAPDTLLSQQIASLPVLLTTYCNTMRDSKNVEKQNAAALKLQQQMKSFALVVANVQAANSASPTTDLFTLNMCNAIAASEVVFKAVSSLLLSEGAYRLLEGTQKLCTSTLENVRQIKGLTTIEARIAKQVEYYQQDINSSTLRKLTRNVFGQ